MAQYFSRRFSRRRLSLAASVWLGVMVACPAFADPFDAPDSHGGGIYAVMLRRAGIETDHQHYTAALALLNKALTGQPDFMSAHFLRSKVLMYVGDFNGALNDINIFLTAHPEYPQGYSIRGIIELHQHQAKPAIADLTHGLSYYYKKPLEVYEGQMYGDRSLAFEMDGNTNAAIGDFALALKAVIGDRRDWQMLGEVCYNANAINFLENAKLACDESISRHSRGNWVYDSRGMTYLKQHQWDNAIADYDQALQYYDDLSQSLYGRGVARHAKGDKAGGDQDIAAAIRVEPDIVAIMTKLSASEAQILSPTKS